MRRGQRDHAVVGGLAGRWYINVHTAANPNGEIRGQMMIGPTPQ
ncbi:MAG: CHRD domain-containing protein [Burkholderiales bacterium]